MSTSASSASPEMPTSAPRVGRGRRSLILALVVVLVLMLVGAAGLFFVAPRLCGLTEPVRHGLACDIPLPAGAQFAGQPNPGSQPAGITAQAWSFTVSNSQVHAVADLYSTHLPGAGWRCVQASVVSDLPQNSQEQVVALSGNRALSVMVTLGPPDNVIHLLIVVSTFAHAAGGAC